VFSQRIPHLMKDPRGVSVRRISQPIVHPLSFAPGGDEAGAPQISEVPRDLRLTGFQNGNKKADADF